MEHNWEPFTKDLVICSQCGKVEDEACPEEQWNREDCEVDPLLE